MNKVPFFLFFLLNIQAFTLLGQDGDPVVDTKKHKIVIQFTQGDSLAQATVVGQVKNIRKSLPNASVEVVCHGGGLDMLVGKTTKVQSTIAELSQQGIVFAACENTMRRKKVKKEDLLKAAITVPSAMVELVVKQEAGWTYLKGGH